MFTHLIYGPTTSKVQCYIWCDYRELQQKAFATHFTPWWRETQHPQINEDLRKSLHPWADTHILTPPHRDTISRPLRSYDARRVKINVTAEPYCALPPLSISFIHRRVIGSQFELPLCLLWAHFALTECGRLMATSSQGRLASASMSALNSLHQFPPVPHSPTHTHKREKNGKKQEGKGIKAK